MVKSKTLVWATTIWTIIGMAALFVALILFCVGFAWPSLETYNPRDTWHGIAGVLFIYGFFTTPAGIFTTLYQLGMLNKKKPAEDKN